MFGYFRPNDADLTPNQFRTFRAYYCRLCYGLRSMGGQRARYLTTFDAAVYYMIYTLASGAPAPSSLGCQKIKKSNMRIVEKDELTMKFVRMTFVAFGEKMRDDKLDGDNFRAGLTNLLFGKAIKASRKAEPELTRISYEGTEELNRLQESGAPTEQLLNFYGKLMSSSLQCCGKVGEKYAELYEAISAWTFYIDILCDYDEDFKKGHFNPLKRDDCATLAELFDREYTALLQLNERIGGRIVEALNAICDGSVVWFTVRNILIHALTTVVPNLLSGKNVKFKYFEELGKNYKTVTLRFKRLDMATEELQRRNDNE